MAIPPTPLSTSQLLDLYKIAVDEYRFEVKLNWDRTAYYLTLNSGLIAIAAGLLKLDNSSAPIVDLLVAVIFLIGLSASAIGIFAILKGHDYYRRTVIKKTLIEDHLGLTRSSLDYAARHTFAVGTTTGQGEHLQILHNTKAWLERRIRARTVTFWIVLILVLFSVANAAGIGCSVWLYCHSRPANENKDADRPVRIIPITSEN